VLRCEECQCVTEDARGWIAQLVASTSGFSRARMLRWLRKCRHHLVVEEAQLVFEARETIDRAACPALDEERVGKRYEEMVEACGPKVLLDFLYPIAGGPGYRERRAQLG
jgi:hypothetical protein